MFYSKFDQAMHELRLAARFLRNFQTAQSRQLHIEIAHLARPLANPVQHFQKLSFIAVAIRNKFFEQGLQSPAGGAKAVDALRILLRRKLQQGPIRLAGTRSWLDARVQST